MQCENCEKSENVKTAREILLELTGIMLFVIKML
jgi:hypothetical protein